MNKYFKTVAIIVVLSLLVCFCGCGEKTKPAEKEPYVIMVNALNGLPVYEQQAQAAQKAAKDYGIKLEITGPSVESEPADAGAIINEYKSAMKAAIAKKPDAIICEPFSPAIYESLEEAHKADIPVFCTSNGLGDGDCYVSCIGTGNAQYGKQAADLLAEKMNNKACVLAVISDETTLNQQVQLEEFKKQCAEKYPDVQVTDVVSDDANVEKATEVFKESFAANSEINAVLMLESAGGPAASAVAKEMGRDICILDIDASEDTVNNILSGDEWATLAQNFFKRGYEIVRMAYEYITQDGKVEYEKFVDSSVVLITKENAADFEKTLWENVRTKGKEW